MVVTLAPKVGLQSPHPNICTTHCDIVMTIMTVSKRMLIDVVKFGVCKELLILYNIPIFVSRVRFSKDSNVGLLSTKMGMFFKHFGRPGLNGRFF